MKDLFSNVPVAKGMVLLHRYRASSAPDEDRYETWTVTSVRRSAKGASVKLLKHSQGAIIEATATFPDGLVRDGWQVFDLSRNDLGHVWKEHEKEMAGA